MLEDDVEEASEVAGGMVSSVEVGSVAESVEELVVVETGSDEGVDGGTTIIGEIPEPVFPIPPAF